MSAGTRRRIVHATFATVLLGSVVAGVVVLLQQGLDNADKIASVVGMAAGVLALIIGVWQLRLALRPAPTTDPGPRIHVSGSVGTAIVGDHTNNTITNHGGP
jgi:hypothetical protein